MGRISNVFQELEKRQKGKGKDLIVVALINTYILTFNLAVNERLSLSSVK